MWLPLEGDTTVFFFFFLSLTIWELDRKMVYASSRFTHFGAPWPVGGANLQTDSMAITLHSINMLQSFFFLLLEAFVWFSPTESIWFRLWLFDCAFTTPASIGTFLVWTSNLNHLLHWGKGWKGLQLFAPPCLCITAEVEYTRMMVLLKFKFMLPVPFVWLQTLHLPTYTDQQGASPPISVFTIIWGSFIQIRHIEAHWGRFV